MDDIQLDRHRLAVKTRPADDLSLDHRRLSPPTGGLYEPDQADSSSVKEKRLTSNAAETFQQITSDLSVFTVVCTATDAPT